MSVEELKSTAQAMVAPGKGILAADESSPTIGKRFAKLGIDSTEENRRSYREMFFTAGGIENYVSGVILYDETIRQSASGGTTFSNLLQSLGMVPGIKVDTGAKELAGAAGEKITEGLDGLRERLAEYYGLGARFAKWRAVITIGDGMPSDYCIHVNAHALGRYAALCQEASIVPIVEPEVLMDWTNTIDVCEDVTRRTLTKVFQELEAQQIMLEGIVLKPNMIVPGIGSGTEASVDEVAERTLAVLKDCVPPQVAGIAFLSGGQSDEAASAHLNRLNQLGGAPWPLTFSYGRALQTAAMQTWAGKPANLGAGQAAALKRAACNSAATYGKYSAGMEMAGV
ncbi:MAG: class I fructose-bisphosphate aldolase [Actinomycetota bacterium]